MSFLSYRHGFGLTLILEQIIFKIDNLTEFDILYPIIVNL